MVYQLAGSLNGARLGPLTANEALAERTTTLRLYDSTTGVSAAVKSCNWPRAEPGVDSRRTCRQPTSLPTSPGTVPRGGPAWNPGLYPVHSGRRGRFRNI